MAQTVCVLPSAVDIERLKRTIGDRNYRLKHVQRAKIVLLSVDRLPVSEVARRAGVSRPAVWCWQRRFAEEGVDGLLRDKTRKPATAPIAKTFVARIVAFRKAGFDVLRWPIRYPTDDEVHYPLVMALHEYVSLLGYRLLGRTEAIFPAPAAAR